MSFWTFTKAIVIREAKIGLILYPTMAIVGGIAAGLYAYFFLPL